METRKIKENQMIGGGFPAMLKLKTRTKNVLVGSDFSQQEP